MTVWPLVRRRLCERIEEVEAEGEEAAEGSAGRGGGAAGLLRVLFSCVWRG